ncbi:MAG: hypothetical protein HZA52_02315 [Planctomycetes bacterium]|nr:hypothetical protein [Planctomycetota bacterium]
MAERATDHAALLAELGTALLAEFGARSIYAALPRYTHDRALIDMLAKLREEQDGVVQRVRSLLRELGETPKRKSWRRVVLANVLALWAWPFSVRLPLRVCADAEETRARWYGHFQEYFLSVGDTARAELCAELQLVKLRHMQALQAWVEHLPT